MRCDLEPSRVAVWRNKDLALRLSGLAAYTLVDAGLMSWDDVRPNSEWWFLTISNRLPDVDRSETRSTGIHAKRHRFIPPGWRCQCRITHHSERVSSGKIASLPLRPLPNKTAPQSVVGTAELFYKPVKWSSLPGFE